MLLRIVDTKHIATTIALIGVCEVSIKGGDVIAIVTDMEIENLEQQVALHSEKEEMDRAVESLG